MSQQTFGSSQDDARVRSHDLFAIEGPLDKKAVIGNPPLRVFVEVVGLAGSLATIMDICGKYRTPPVMVGSAGLVIAWLEFFRRYVMAVGADRRPESRVVLTSLISTRSDSQLFVNGTKVTPTASEHSSLVPRGFSASQTPL